jgi:hypothetical protein
MINSQTAPGSNIEPEVSFRPVWAWSEDKSQQTAMIFVVKPYLFTDLSGARVASNGNDREIRFLIQKK